MIFFLVFKSPPEGRTHIFRPGEAFAQIFIVPEEATFDLVPMSDEEAAERELQSRRIFQSRDTLSAETKWTSATNTVFDGTYRHILGAASKRPSSAAEGGGFPERQPEVFDELLGARRALAGADWLLWI